MEIFFTFENGQIVEMKGTLESVRRGRKTYKVGNLTYTGFVTRRAARIALTDQQARILCRKAHKKCGSLRIKDIKKLKPEGCKQFVDWYKWIIMYDGIPENINSTDFNRVDEYYEKHLQGTLGNHLRKRRHQQNTDTPSKRRRRLYHMICDAKEEQLESIEEYLNTII